MLTLTIDVTCTTTLQTREEKYKNHPLSSVIFKRICIESRISSYFTSQQLPFQYESRLVYYENNKSSLHQRATTTQTHQAFRLSKANSLCFSRSSRTGSKETIGSTTTWSPWSSTTTSTTSRTLLVDWSWTHWNILTRHRSLSHHWMSIRHCILRHCRMRIISRKHHSLRYILSISGSIWRRHWRRVLIHDGDLTIDIWWRVPVRWRRRWGSHTSMHRYMHRNMHWTTPMRNPSLTSTHLNRGPLRWPCS